MKVKTAELNGVQLDYAVADAIGRDVIFEKESGLTWMNDDFTWLAWAPSFDWSQCGPLIDQHDVDISPQYPGYFASAKMGIRSFGDTRQIAICRAVVASKLGDEVDIPDELMESK